MSLMSPSKEELIRKHQTDLETPVILATSEQKPELFCFVLLLVALPQGWLCLSQGTAAAWA